jgi:hypothetical protein
MPRQLVSRSDCTQPGSGTSRKSFELFCPFVLVCVVARIRLHVLHGLGDANAAGGLLKGLLPHRQGVQGGPRGTGATHNKRKRGAARDLRHDALELFNGDLGAVLAHLKHPGSQTMRTRNVRRVPLCKPCAFVSDLCPCVRFGAISGLLPTWPTSTPTDPIRQRPRSTVSWAIKIAVTVTVTACAYAYGLRQSLSHSHWAKMAQACTVPNRARWA